MNPIIKQVPILGQFCAFTKTAMKIYNLTSPVEAVKEATVSVINDFTSPQIKYSVKCAVLIA